MQCYVLYVNIFVEWTPAYFTELKGCLALRCRDVMWPTAEELLMQCSNWVRGMGDVSDVALVFFLMGCSD